MLKPSRALRQVSFKTSSELSGSIKFDIFIFFSVFNESSIQNRLVAGATVLIVFIVVLAIVATVLVLRTKNQDDLDKKTSNHLPLPLDYASNEGLLSVFCAPFSIHATLTKKNRRKMISHSSCLYFFSLNEKLFFSFFVALVSLGGVYLRKLNFQQYFFVDFSLQV